MEISEILKQMREAAKGGQQFTYSMLTGWADAIEAEFQKTMENWSADSTKSSTAIVELDRQLADSQELLRDLTKENTLLRDGIAKAKADSQALAAKLNPTITDPMALAKLVCSIQSEIGDQNLAWSARSPRLRALDLKTAEAVVERWSTQSPAVVQKPSIQPSIQQGPSIFVDAT